MSATLKPCPFCDSTKVEVFYLDWEFYHVECDDCGTSGPKADLDEVEDCIPATAEALACERWNRRVGGTP